MALRVCGVRDTKPKGMMRMSGMGNGERDNSLLDFWKSRDRSNALVDRDTVRVYLSGPMSNIAEFNFPAFTRAAEALRGWGYTVFNPAEQGWGEGDPETGTISTDEYNQFLREDIRQVTTADMVVVLDGWEKSNGASFEVDVAQRLGIPVKRLLPPQTFGFGNSLEFTGLASLEDTDVPAWAEERVVLPESELCTCGPFTRGMGRCDCGASPAAKRANEERITSTTGGEKGKKAEQFSAMPWDVLQELARHYGEGAKKYAAHNYRRGYDWSLSFDAAQRHLAAFWAGETLDEETGSKHVVAAAFHCLALAVFINDHPSFDDRYVAEVQGG